jgi:hypothetical protein
MISSFEPHHYSLFAARWPSEHSKFLLRMLENTNLGNGRQNQKPQILKLILCDE